MPQAEPEVEQGEKPTQPPAAEAPSLIGPVLLWYATLAGAILWAVHEIAAWGVVELACARGHHSVLGVSLRTFLILATAIPLAGAALALVIAVLAHRRLGKVADPDRRIERGRFQAEVGMYSDGLAVLIILLDGAAVFALAPCAR
jgi:hypothetical protein